MTNNNTSYQPLLVLHLYLKHDRFLAVKQKNVASVGTKLLRQAEQSSSYLGVKLSLVPAENDVLTDKTYFPSTYCAGSTVLLKDCGIICEKSTFVTVIHCVLHKIQVRTLWIRRMELRK